MASPLAHQEGHRGLLAQLDGTSASLVTASYGNELVLGFGERRDRALGDLLVPWAEWMLFTRSTPWFFETDDGILATHQHRLSENLLGRLTNAITDAHVEDAHIRTKALALDVEFSNRSRLVLTPKRRTRAADEVWTLSTPAGTILRALSSGEMDLVDGEQTVEGSGVLVDPLDELGADELLPAARASSERAVFDAMRAVARSSSFEVFGPLMAGSSLADFVLMKPDGEVVLVQIKTPGRTLSPSGRVPRIVVTVDPLSEEELESVRSEPRALVLPLSEIATETFAEMVERLAG